VRSCHGHPYDPFTHNEYYQLLAFFNNTADADREDEAPTRRFYAGADSEKPGLLESNKSPRRSSSLKANSSERRTAKRSRNGCAKCGQWTIFCRSGI